MRRGNSLCSRDLASKVTLGARDYDPIVGRWTAKDPSQFRNEDLPNLYLYTNGDPVNFVDLTGHQTIPMPIPWGPILGGAAAGAAVGGAVGALVGACMAAMMVPGDTPQPDCTDAAESCTNQCSYLLGQNYRPPRGKRSGGGTNTQFGFAECYRECMTAKGC